jgi:hypothetical protein
MNNVINLHTKRQTRLQTRAHGVTLCRSGFHKWKPLTEARFDVKHGKLLTAERCTRCRAESH